MRTLIQKCLYAVAGLLVFCLAVITFIIYLQKPLNRPLTSKPKVAGDQTIVVAAPHLNPNENAPKPVSYQVPILMYHYIRIAPAGDRMGKGLSVSPQNFADQMQWLKENNYETIKVSDMADKNKTAIAKALAKGKKPIILTFDDGYDDAYTAAFPVLKRYDYLGVFYIIRGFVGKPHYMTQSEVDSLEQAGNEIGSHTINHLNLAVINQFQAHYQIFSSKDHALTFCYPSGKYTNETVQLLKSADYLAAVSEIPGIANQNSDLFQLPRIRMNDFSGQTLIQKLKSSSFPPKDTSY